MTSLWRRILVERRAVILPVVALVAINVVVLVAVVLPLRHSVATAQDDRNASYARLGNAKANRTLAEKEAASTKDASAGLQRFYADILSTNQAKATNAAQFWTSQTARALGLQYITIETTTTPVRESKLVRVTSRFTIRGEYASIRKFIYAVEAAEEFLIIDKIKLAERAAMQQQNSNLLEFELFITSYFVGGA